MRIIVPCSTSNLGPGFDCLGLALERRLTVEIGDAPFETGAPRLVEATGTLAEAPTAAPERIAAAYAQIAAIAGVEAGAPAFRAHSTIPVARGLGSSGSATVAGMLLAQRRLGLEFSPSELFRIGCELEGHPDNIGPALFGGCVVAAPGATGRIHWFQQPIHPLLRVAVAWPKSRVETARARAVLPAQVPFAVARDQARRLVQLLRGLEELDGERIAFGIEDALHTPYRLPLIPGGARVLAAAREAGAYGAAISGSGSAMIAIGADPMDRVADAMRRAFEEAGERAEAFVSRIPQRGARLEEK